MAAVTHPVHYEYDPKLEAIVARRDTGQQRIAVRVPSIPTLEGGPNTFSPSRDGRYLAYVDSRRRMLIGFGFRDELFLADLETGERKRIALLIERECVQWSRDSRHVYFANGEGQGPMQVRVVDVDRTFGRR